MTSLGKLLLFVNLVMSGLMAGWAFSLYANYADPSDRPASGGQPAGLVGARKERIKDLQAGLVPPQNTWMRVRRVLHLQENQRQGDLAWYRGELEHLRAGATEANPARLVAIDNHQPVADPANANRPKMAPAADRSGQPLMSMDVYEKMSRETLEKLSVALHDFSLKSVEDAELTTRLETLTDKELTGVTALLDSLKEQADAAERAGRKADAEQLAQLSERVQKLVPEVGKKGLQQRVSDERYKREGILAELQAVEPLWKVNEVDTELLLRRRETIDERLEELKNYLKRRHNFVAAGAR